jgi:hypothetical protein
MEPEYVKTRAFFNENNLSDMDNVRASENSENPLDNFSMVTGIENIKKELEESESEFSFDLSKSEEESARHTPSERSGRSAESSDRSMEMSSSVDGNIAPVVTKASNSTDHAKTILNIKNIKKDMTDIGLEWNAYDEARILKDPKYAEEIKNMLHDEFGEYTFSTGIREVILRTAMIIPAVFDGKRMVMGKVLPNMEGYDRRVKSKISNIKRETIMLARSTKKIIGEDIISVFQVFRTLGVPLITTYLENNMGSDKYEKMDSDDYDILD